MDTAYALSFSCILRHEFNTKIDLSINKLSEKLCIFASQGAELSTRLQALAAITIRSTFTGDGMGRRKVFHFIWPAKTPSFSFDRFLLHMPECRNGVHVGR